MWIKEESKGNILKERIEASYPNLHNSVAVYACVADFFAIRDHERSISTSSFPELISIFHLNSYTYI